MKIITLAALVVIYLAVVLAQTAQEKKGDAAALKVPPDIALEIRDAQLEQTRAQAQQQQIIGQYKDLQTTIQNDATKLEGLREKALEAMKLDKKDWDINGDTLTAVKKAAAPASPASSPAPSSSPAPAETGK